MPKRRDLPRPVMRGRTCLHTNQAGRLFLEEGQHLTPPQLTADDHGSLGVNAMHLNVNAGVKVHHWPA